MIASTKRKFTVVLLCASLTGCVSLSPLKMLSGGGPNVAANTNVGKTNNQTIGTNDTKDQKIEDSSAKTIIQSADENQVSANTIENQMINQIGITPLDAVGFTLFFVLWTWFWYEMPAPRHMRAWMSKKWKAKFSSGES